MPPTKSRRIEDLWEHFLEALDLSMGFGSVDSACVTFNQFHWTFVGHFSWNSLYFSHHCFTSDSFISTDGLQYLNWTNLPVRWIVFLEQVNWLSFAHKRRCFVTSQSLDLPLYKGDVTQG
jgi:hypothetical protein